MDARKLVAIAVAVVIVAGTFALYLSRPPTQHRQASAGRASSLPPTPCGQLQFARSALSVLTFNSSTPCFEGTPGWLSNISVAWVSVNGSANVEATWSCLGLGCVTEAAHSVYNATGSQGAFGFVVSSLGAQWQNVSAVDFTLWASPGSTPGTPLPSGSQVQMLVVVK